MRRTLLGITITGLLLVVFFLIYFTFSPFRSSSQSYLTSLSDFFFMLGSIQRELTDAPPPELTQDSFDQVMDRFRRTAHYEVRYHALRTVKAWGTEAGPYLEKEAHPSGEPYRLVAVADSLVAIQHPRAAPLIGAMLTVYAEDLRRFRSDFLDALGDTGDPQALEILIPVYQKYGNSLGDALEAIGKCGGVDFLLAQLNATQDPEMIRKLSWPLAHTGSPEAAKALVALLQHPDGSVRLRARSAMAQTMGREVVAPLIDLLQRSGDEFLIGGAINQILARSRNRGQPQLVPYLYSMAQHPVLGWEARYALAQLGGKDALAAMHQLAKELPPEEVMEHLDFMGTAGLPLLQTYFEHPVPRIRRRALFKAEAMLLPDTRPLIESLLEDPVPANRKLAQEALYRLDRLDLFRSFTDALPPDAGRAARRGFRNDLHWGFDEGYRYVLQIFTFVHWVGIVVSGLLGLLLIFNRVRIFESYRFNLFAAFLLAEGLAGNFFLLGSNWRHPETVFQWVTGVHLLLLIGLLFQERETTFREMRSRFERLGGASLWLLMPPLLYLGTPLLADGLRLAFRDWSSFQYYIWFAFIATVLVLEQWALPWRLFARRWNMERVLTIGLTGSLLMLFVWPLYLLAQQQFAANDEDGAVITLLLMAPLLWMFVYHLAHLNLLVPQSRKKLPPSPGNRLEVLRTGDKVTIRPRRKLSFWRLWIPTVVTLFSGGLAAYLAARYGGGAPGMVLAFIAGLVGAAVAGLLLDSLWGRAVFQVRNGGMRAAITHFGASFRGGNWRARPVLTPVVAACFSADSGADTGTVTAKASPFTAEERQWLQRLRSGQVSKPAGVASGGALS